ncbi:MAG TPA: amidohydrolase family protein [Steroidobacteraceae bacterium]|nr:amidohydrolase family protein [Steroidobacteraceae bacterium]
MNYKTALAVWALVMSFPAGAQVRAFAGATIIDGNGGAPIRNGVVLIDGKTIKAVGPAARVPIPQGAEKIDVSGKFVLPGLIDGNVHLIPWPSWTYIEFLARYEDNFEGIIEEAAQIALKHGFTTVFDSMGPLHPLVNVRDRINRGEAEGSRMFVAGDIVGFRAVFTSLESIKSATPAFQARINALFELNGGQDLPWKSPDQIRVEMTNYVKEGADFVKFGATGDGKPLNSETGQDAVLRFTPEQQRAMVEAVHAAGKIIQTHQTSAESLQIVVESGVDMAQHCAHTGPSRIHESTIKLMLQRKFYCGTQWGPLSEEEQKGVREGKFSGGGTDAENGKEGVDYNLENSVRLIKAGVPHILSTDAGTIDPDVEKDPNGAWGGLGGKSSLIGEAEFIEMRAMHQRGMTPMMVIQASTRNVAAAYHKLAEFGTLEPGKSADLVVLDADPLADIENMRSVSTVVKEGRTVDRAALPRTPVLTSAEAMNPGPVRRK